MSTGRGGQEPAQRVLEDAVEVLKKHNGKRRQGRHSQQAAWLQPNWPPSFVIANHRDRLVRLLIDDAELRAQLRRKLASGHSATLDAISADTLDHALEHAADPYVVLLNAMTHIDLDVVTAAAMYLRDQKSVPPSASVPSPEGPATSVPSRARSERRDQPTGQREADARRQARRAEKRVERLESEVQKLRSELEQARAETAAKQQDLVELAKKLPARKQQLALENAERIQRELKQARQALRRADNERDGVLNQLRADLTREMGDNRRLRAELEAEQRGRRRLSDELGDSTERARRLLTLVLHEIGELDKQMIQDRPGRDRTRTKKRRDQLAELCDLLRALFDLERGSDVHRETDPPVAAQRQKLVDVVERRSITVTPLGGNDHIGGSALLIECADTRVLVDAGLRPNASLSNPGPRGIDVAVDGRLDAIIVTHAHADHAGFVPWVIGKQRHAQIYCTPETAALLPTVWADSVRVMRAEADARYRPAERAEPPYGDTEVSQAEDAIYKLACGQTRLLRDVEITLFPAGHILGAAGVVIKAGDRRVVITGDIDDRTQDSVGAARVPPRLAAEADLFVIETTYCNRAHPDRSHETSDLIRSTESVLASGGRVLVPAVASTRVVYESGLIGVTGVS